MAKKFGDGFLFICYQGRWVVGFGERGSSAWSTCANLFGGSMGSTHLKVLSSLGFTQYDFVSEMKCQVVRRGVIDGSKRTFVGDQCVRKNVLIEFRHSQFESPILIDLTTKSATNLFAAPQRLVLCSAAIRDV